MDAAGAQPSIHYRRRWWYVLWASLLAASLGFLVLWETPASRGEGHMLISLSVMSQPPTQVDWWVGPHRQWRGAETVYQGTGQFSNSTPGWLKLPPLAIRMAVRRFHQGYIPRGTADWVVLRIRIPQQAPRYAVYDLQPDLNRGYMAPHRRIYLGLPLSWTQLSQDAAQPTLLQ